MLPEHKLKAFLDLLKSSGREELAWMNGYLAGLLASGQEQQAPVPVQPVSQSALPKITIAYGTETGNSKKLAIDFATQAKKNGINAKLVSLDQYRVNDLSKEEYFFTVISTQGEGEPPAAAKKFYDHIHQNGFKLEHLKYGVLALGDTSYPLFCKAGEDVDSQLQKLGGKRIVSLQKCDTDFQTEANGWFSQVLQNLHVNSNGNGAVITAPVTAKKSTGKKTYTGTILSHVNLNDRGSEKQTYHIEVAVDGEPDYQPGDSIGIIPKNHKVLVESILALAGIDGEKSLTWRNENISIKNLLTHKLNIAYLPERVVSKYAAIVKQEIPETKIGLAELLRIYPVKDAVQLDEVIGILEPITPRLYSVSSSPAAHTGEMHITVARDTFCINKEQKFGLCSDYLAQLPENSVFEFYVNRNNQFRLPAPGKDIIMIGPGTGIAPFRSFLAERDATSAKGRNWLFFGEQHFISDFLYQTEIQNWGPEI